MDCKILFGNLQPSVVVVVVVVVVVFLAYVVEVI